jgi:uncharacterized membrane protein YphA (DoxX/SURF4 family)
LTGSRSSLFARIFDPGNARASLLIRVAVGFVVGFVFLSEGIQKFTGFAMLLGTLFLLIAGAGSWSLDARIAHRRSAP